MEHPYKFQFEYEEGIDGSKECSRVRFVTYGHTAAEALKTEIVFSVTKRGCAAPDCELDKKLRPIASIMASACCIRSSACAPVTDIHKQLSHFL